MIVGLTGGSGSGKSMVAGVLEENGFEVIDFDKISRNVSRTGSECLREICCEFGTGVLNEDGSLNRKALGNIVFSDSGKLSVLNSITHKYILKESEETVSGSKNENFVFDAPLLFEAGLEKKCDCVISVLCDVKKRIERICVRDSISEQSALNRINSQHSDDYYILGSHYVIYNNGSADELRENALCVLNKLRSGAHINSPSVLVVGKDVSV